MKPIGPIPAGFSVQDGHLIIGGRPAAAWAEDVGRTPLFIYSRAHIDARIAQLRAAMPKRLHIHYAIKANPYPEILGVMRGLVDGFDIASGGELDGALKAGIDPAKVSFAGPGKRDAEIAAAVTHGVTLHCESEGECDRVLRCADHLGVVPKVALRVNPNFELRGSGMKMGGGAKPFGIDEDQIAPLAKRLIAQGISWQGLHVYSGSQALSHDAIIDMQNNVIDLAARLSADIGVALPKLNMGGGFGIPYFHGDEPLDIHAIGAALDARFHSLPDVLQDTSMCIELGRYLVGEAGVYLTRVIDRKISHGAVFLVTDGGLHHQLAASGNFGTVVRRNYPVAIANKFGQTPIEIASIVGCLCTPLDRLADLVHIPHAEAGDLVAVFCAGAYGASASPSAFLGQGPAEEIMV